MVFSFPITYVQSRERTLYTDLLIVIQDIIDNHDKNKTSGAVLVDLGRVLPELLEAVLCDDMPAVCRRELTTCLGAVVQTGRGKNPLTANVTKFKDLLMSDDYNTTNAVVLSNQRYAHMPSSLAAFSGALDTCGDFATQCNMVQILLAAAKHGGLDPSVVAKGFGELRKSFLALVQDVDAKDAELMTRCQDLVTEYNISRGGNASVKCIMAKRITVGGGLCECPWVHFNGVNAISISMKFPGSPQGDPVDFYYDGCIRCVSMPSPTSIAFGVSERPWGFGRDDDYDCYDDQWVVMDFTAPKFANVQEALLRASRTNEVLSEVTAKMYPVSHRPTASKESRGVQIGNLSQQPPPRLGTLTSSHAYAVCPTSKTYSTCARVRAAPAPPSNYDSAFTQDGCYLTILVAKATKMESSRSSKA